MLNIDINRPLLVRLHWVYYQPKFQIEGGVFEVVIEHPFTLKKDDVVQKGLAPHS